VIRVISGDNELAALEFHKHYRLPIVHLLDPDRQFERQYQRDGWPFMMLVDSDGKVIHKANNLLDREMPKLAPLLDRALARPPNCRPVIREGVPYMPATLKRSGEGATAKRHDRFPSIACGPDGRVYLALTSNRSGNSDVFLRVFDGKRWSEDRPVAATAADEYDASVVVGKDNRLWLSWTSNADGKNYNIFVASVGDLSGPIRATQLTRADDDAMHARLACDGAGRIWVSYYKWQKMRGVSRDKEVHLRRHDGTKWSKALRVSPTDVPSYEDHSDPAIAPYGGGVVVCWSWDFHRPRGYTRNAREPTVFIRTVSGDMSLGKPLAVSGTHIDTAPAVAVDGDGHIWCAWDSLGWSGSSGAFCKALHVRQCAPKARAPRSAAKPIARAVVNVCTPRLAAGPGGRLTVIWSEKAAGGGRWLLKRADYQAKDRRFSAATTIEASGNPRFPCAAYDSEGNLWVAYSQDTSLGREVRVKKIPPAGE
jgi:hypothetical protein